MKMLDKFKGKKLLIAYFTVSGRTRALAEMIGERTGGGLYEIEPAAPYPQDYQACVAAGKKELQDKARPALRRSLPDLSQYDAVFVGFPVWFGLPPMAVYTFLEGCRWQGRTLAPFLTHGGGGAYKCFDEVAKVAAGATAAPGLVLFDGDVERSGSAVDAWLAGLEL
jgi:flavodoxin